MPIPARVKRMFDSPYWASAGTRDASLVPAYHLVWGARPTADGQHLEALVPAFVTQGLRENLADNQRIAVSMNEPMTAESYQLKGRSVEVRDATDEERAFQRAVTNTNIEHFRKFMPPHLCDKMLRIAEAPATYVRFVVEEVYVQTPGPGAGERLPLEP